MDHSSAGSVSCNDCSICINFKAGNRSLSAAEEGDTMPNAFIAKMRNRFDRIHPAGISMMIAEETRGGESAGQQRECLFRSSSIRDLRLWQLACVERSCGFLKPILGVIVILASGQDVWCRIEDAFVLGLPPFSQCFHRDVQVIIVCVVRSDHARDIGARPIWNLQVHQTLQGCFS